MSERYYKTDQYFEFTFQTQAATGVATDATGTPTYRVYEVDGTDTVVDNGNCALVDDGNTVGFYRARGQCTAALGYEVGKSYEVRVAATVATIAGAGVVGRFTMLSAAVYDWLMGATAPNTVTPDAAGTLAAALTVIKGATWSASTDTLEAIRDRGDAAWITATGFATPTNITAASGVSLAASQHVIVDSGTVTTVTNQLTAAAIATGVWQDATAGDFTAANSIGKSLYTGGVVPGGTNGLFIAGTNAATTITTGLTTHFIGTVDTVTTYTGNTPQTGDSYAIANSGTYGNAAIKTALDTLTGGGAGAITDTITVYRPGTTTPLAGVGVWVTTDSAGTSISAGTLVTNASGVVTFNLDIGTYYVWSQLSGYEFTNPRTLTVGAGGFTWA